MPTLAEKPEVARGLSLDEEVGGALPVSLSALAGMFPEYKDPVVDELDADAYTRIRRCFATAAPVRKLLGRVATWRWTAVGEGPQQNLVQDVIDLMRRKQATIQGLGWALIEGVRFGWLTARPRAGKVVPGISVRKKTKAGGTLQWDGASVVKPRRDLTTAEGVPESEKQALRLDRSRLIVFTNTSESEPEGDQDIGWLMFRIAQSAELAEKTLFRYCDRHGLPWEMIKVALHGVRPHHAAAKLTTAKDKLDQVNRQGLALSMKDAIELLEPSGTTSQFLIDYYALLRMQAQMLVLQNTLTSETHDAGPTGSSRVHAEEEDLAVQVLAETIGEQLTVDLLPFIRFYNSAIWPEEGRVDAIELQPDDPPRAEPTIDEILRASEKIDFRADYIYGALGAEIPKGTPEIIKATGVVTRGADGMPVPVPPGNGRADRGGTGDEDEAKMRALRFGASRLVTLRQPGGQAGTAEAERARVEREHRSRWLAFLALLAILVFRNEGDPGEETTTETTDILGDAYRVGHRLARDSALAVVPDAPRVRAPTASRIEGAVRPLAEETARSVVTSVQAQVLAIEAELRGEGSPPLTAAAMEEAIRSRLARDPRVLAGPAALMAAMIARAYGAGFDDGFNAVRAAAVEAPPNWRYWTQDDGRVRPLHRTYHGLVFPPDGYELWIPPNDWNCRCWREMVNPADHPVSRGIEALIPPGRWT